MLKILAALAVSSWLLATCGASPALAAGEPRTVEIVAPAGTVIPVGLLCEDRADADAIFDAVLAGREAFMKVLERVRNDETFKCFRLPAPINVTLVKAHRVDQINMGPSGQLVLYEATTSTGLTVYVFGLHE